MIEAATGELLGDGASATEADVDAAVAAARAALPDWRATSPDHRAGVLKAFAAALHRRAESTDILVTRENGMPMSLSRKTTAARPGNSHGAPPRLRMRARERLARPPSTPDKRVRQFPHPCATSSSTLR